MHFFVDMFIDIEFCQYCIVVHIHLQSLRVQVNRHCSEHFMMSLL